MSILPTDAPHQGASHHPALRTRALRVCLYLRKSPNAGKRAREKEEISLEYQEQRLREWCQEQGWEVVAVRSESHPRYVLKARPVLMQVVRECAQGRYDLVLCYDMTRLTSDGDDYGWLAVELRDSGVRLRLRHDDPGDGPYAGVIRHLQADGSGAEVRLIRTRTAEGKRSRMEVKKLPLARTAPYGMVWNHVADPASAPLASQRFAYLQPKKDATAAVARRCLEEIATGQTSAGELVRRLNAEGVPAPRGGAWTRAGLAVVLHNPVYCGLEVTGRTKRRRAGLGYDERWVRDRVRRDDWRLLEVKHRPLVSVQVWEAAQRALEGRTVRGAASVAGRALLRGGLATCAGCDRPLWTGGQYRVVEDRPDGAAAGVTVVYYQCASQHSVTRDAIEAGQQAPCPAPATVRADRLDAAVWRAVLDYEPPAPPTPEGAAAEARERERAQRANAREQAKERRVLQEGTRSALLEADPHRRAALEAVLAASTARLRTLEDEADALATEARRVGHAQDEQRATYVALLDHRDELLKCRPWGADAGRDADMRALVRALRVRAVVTRPERARERAAVRWALTVGGAAAAGGGATGDASTTRRGLLGRNSSGLPEPLREALARFAPHGLTPASGAAAAPAGPAPTAG